MTPRWRVCRKCGSRYERIKKKCPGCATKAPPKRVPKHARTLRDDSYETYCAVNAQIHGVTDEACGVCGKPRSFERRHDRDHGHLQGSLTFGKPRGLACVPCNRLMPRELTAERAQLIADYLKRTDNHYRKGSE